MRLIEEILLVDVDVHWHVARGVVDGNFVWHYGAGRVRVEALVGPLGLRRV